MKTSANGSVLRVTSIAEVDRHIEAIGAAADRVREWLLGQDHAGLEFLKAIKFDPIGWHPTDGHALNCIEQVNQTFTYLVAFEAARFLLERHPEAGGFDLAPGAHMAILETGYIINGAVEGQCRLRTNAGYSHQPPADRVGSRQLGKAFVDQANLLIHRFGNFNKRANVRIDVHPISSQHVQLRFDIL